MTSTNRKLFRDRSGTTLIELILVMAIIFVMAGVLAPRLSDFFPGLQLRKTSDRFLAWALKARADAAVTGCRQRLVFDLKDRKFWIEVERKPLREPGVFAEPSGDAEKESWPEEVSLESTDGLESKPHSSALRYIEFRPDGTSFDCSFVVANERGGKRTIRVDAATSRVTIDPSAEQK